MTSLGLDSIPFVGPSHPGIFHNPTTHTSLSISGESWDQPHPGDAGTHIPVPCPAADQKLPALAGFPAWPGRPSQALLRLGRVPGDHVGSGAAAGLQQDEPVPTEPAPVPLRQPDQAALPRYPRLQKPRLRGGLGSRPPKNPRGEREETQGGPRRMSSVQLGGQRCPNPFFGGFPEVFQLQQGEVGWPEIPQSPFLGVPKPSTFTRARLGVQNFPNPFFWVFWSPTERPPLIRVRLGGQSSPSPHCFGPPKPSTFNWVRLGGQRSPNSIFLGCRRAF